MDTTCQWDDLHPELWVSVFLSCPWVTSCSLLSVCKTFNKLLDSKIRAQILELSPPYHLIIKEEMFGVEPKESFDDMGLESDLLRGVYSYGFEKPSAIQRKAIPSFLR